MKAITLILLSLSVVGCSKVIDAPKTIDEAKPLLTKRWVQSPLHCQSLLDERITDFTFTNEGVITSGNLSKGVYSFYKNPDMQAMVNNYIDSNEKCPAIPKSGSPFALIQFASYEQSYVLAVFLGNDFMLRIINDEIYPVLPFPENSDYLKELHYAN